MSMSPAFRSDVPDPEQPSRRWPALAFIGLAQLMVALDATIVSIALPSAQRALRISDADRQWMITAYTLAFGGLLLLGGRVADRFGRKRTFLVGLAGFALASALGGAAPIFAILVGARALQGAFGALLAPTALSLLAVMFTEPRERAKAFAVYGAIAGSGAAVGMLLGGVLTQYLTWRWCLYVNVPIAVVAAAGAAKFLKTSAAAGRTRFDIPGVLLATASRAGLPAHHPCVADRLLGRQPADAAPTGGSADGPRGPARRRRDGPAHATAGAWRLPQPGVAGRGPPRNGDRLRDGAGLQHRHPRG